MKTTAFTLIFCLFHCFPLFTQSVENQLDESKIKSLFDSFERDSFLTLTLETDFSHLKKKKELKAYQPAKLSYKDDIDTPVSWEVEIKTRGHMRLDLCEFPPLRIKFSKKDLEERGFQPYHTLEISLACKKQKSYQQYILKEFLAYRLYNLLTDRSFRVRLARVRIFDSKNNEQVIESFAVLLESQKELEARLDAKSIKAKGLDYKKLSNEDFDRLSMFEYMIGNTDWFINNQHNVKLLGMKGVSMPVAVPYDFDYSGLVATPYAVHHDRFVSPSITTRFYMGACRSEEEMTKTAELFLQKKNEILDAADGIYGLEKKEKEEAQKYLSEFFDRISDAKKRKRNLYNECGKWLE